MLLAPRNFGGDRAQHLFVARVTSGDRARQEEDGFLDVWGEVEKVHDLRHSWLRDVGEAGEFGLADDFAVAEQLIEPDGQGHESGDTGDAAFDGCWFFPGRRVDALSPMSLPVK